MKLVLGAKGRLGTSLCSQFAAEGVIAPDRSVYETWWQRGSEAVITKYLQMHCSSVDAIFVTAGIIDPLAPATDHERVNCLLPQQVVQAAEPLGIRVITFGTVMETLAHNNPSRYVASKVALANFVEQRARAGSGVMHVRIHTLYGGRPPAEFMFAGQMLRALRTQQPFLMSPGLQLREYHHLDDEGPAIAALEASDACGVIELNHGNSVPLAEIAESTFRLLGATHLLRIGALPMPVGENLGVRFTRPALLAGHVFRDVRLAMADYLRAHLPHASASE
jgi:nucleoside-diphosphate-sugar epimerase